MATLSSPADRFLNLHRPGAPLLMANAWDRGSARLLVSLGYDAIATTSSGHAATLGRRDYGAGREEALAHAAAIVQVSEVPVSADLENAFADDCAGVAQTVALARECGLAGCSIEDWNPAAGELYDRATAAERVAAAAGAAHDGGDRLVLTARAENLLRGQHDLEETIARLQLYEQAGADVLYAPALRSAEDIARVLAAVGRPLNVLALPGLPAVGELASLGVARVSVGGAFAFAAYGAALAAAQELLREGTYGFCELAATGSTAAREAFI